MIVKCAENRLEKVCNDKTSELLLKNYKSLEGEDEALKKGQCYVVYSLFVTDKDFKWYLHRCDLSCPVWSPEIFFEVIDPTPSKYWMTFWVEGIALTHEKGKLYTFPEFTEKDDFYYNLVERCEQEVKIFNEFADKIRDDAIL